MDAKSTRRPTFLEGHGVRELRTLALPQVVRVGESAPAMRASSAVPRRPSFLSGPRAVPASFAHAASQGVGAARSTAEAQLDGLSRSGLPASAEAELAAAMAALDGERSAMQARLAGSLAALEQRGAKLADEARSDVLELAFQIARRVLEAELRTGPEPFLALVRSAIRRVGEASVIQVRVCPLDMGALQGPKAKDTLRTAGTARVEIVADVALEPGDCRIDSERASVDGRLATRLAALRGALDPAADLEGVA